MLALELLIQGLVQGAIYALIALGLTLVYGLPLTLTLLPAALTAACIGFVVGLTSLRVRHDFLAITTMGVAFLFIGIVRKTEALGGEIGLSGIPAPDFGRPGLLVLSTLCAIGFMVLVLAMRRSWTGFAFESIADDEDTARLLGIDVPRFKLFAFVIGTAGAGVAGALNLTDNVALAAGHGRLLSPWKAMFQHDTQSERARAQVLLEQVELGDAADRMPSTLPLGYLKRLEVARALALEPRVLLLDEPLAGLNASEAAAMADLIAALPRAGLAVVLIEHNLGEVMRVCPTLYVQDNGRSLGQGPAAEMMARDDVRAAYLGTPTEAVD